MRTPSATRSVAAIVLAAALQLAPAAAEAQRATGSFDRTLSVSGAPDVEIDSGSGRIEVRAGSASRVAISAVVRTTGGWGWRRSTASAEERIRRIEASPPIEQNGNIIRIGQLSESDREGVSISYTVTVPPNANIRSKSGSGSQEIEGVSGDVEARSGSGSLTFRNVGPLRASAGSGSIKADSVAGAFSATAGSGSIEALRVAGPITAKTSSGGINLQQTGSGDVQAGSSSGSVNLRGVRGGLRASTSSGSIDIQGELTGEWRLSASSGSIHINLPARQGFELDAGTSSGRIDVDVPIAISGTVNRRALRGSAHGGGPLLHVRTSSGGIEIR